VNEAVDKYVKERLLSQQQDFKAGDIILSRDGKTQYQIQKDGSWRKVQDQKPGDLEKLL
jgi:NADPH-dependent curcumin reductase CurA